MRCPLRFWGAAALLLSLLAGSAAAQGKKGGGKNPPPPPPPPVLYRVQLWTGPGGQIVRDIYDINNARQAVGPYGLDVDGDGNWDFERPFLYDPAVDPDEAVDLNDIVANVPTGWAIRKASAINETGLIVAHMEPIGPPRAPLTVLQSVLIDINASPPVLHLLPESSFTDYAVPGDVNDLGDMVVRYRRADGTFGHYVYNFDPASGITAPIDLGITTSVAAAPRINNAREVVGSLGAGGAYRLTWGGGFTSFSGLQPRALNEQGAFCGVATISTKKKGGSQTTTAGFIQDANLELLTNTTSARDLNESKDVLELWKLHHRAHGTLNLRSLLDPTDPAVALFPTDSSVFCYVMTDRIAGSEFPVLAGAHSDFAFYLVPVVSP